MALERKLIKKESYNNRTLEARYMGPDLLAYCNGMELANFYVDVEAALGAGRRHVDYEEQSRAEAAAKNQRKK